MNAISRVINSSLGRKYVMAASGLFLCIFLLEHLYTNLLLYAEFFNPEDKGQAFIEASHNMVHNLLIRIVEIILFAAIIIHVYQAWQLTQQNRKARPIKYAVARIDETSTWFSRNMGLTGSLILFFIVIHLYTFFLPYRITDTAAFASGARNAATEVKLAFQSPIYSGWYIVALLFLGFHLNHGFQSAFQSLGYNNKKYAPVLRQVGTGFAILITVGFLSFPILFFLGIAGKTF